MAQIITTVDDITGEPGAETIDFGVEGKYYRIDLTEEGKAEFLAAMRPYMAHGQHCGNMELSAKGQKSRPAPTISKRDHFGRHTPEEVQACREWAARIGVNLPPGQGRIPVDIWEAHDADDITLLRPGRLPDATLTPRQQQMLDMDARAS